MVLIYTHRLNTLIFDPNKLIKEKKVFDKISRRAIPKVFEKEKINKIKICQLLLPSVSLLRQWVFNYSNTNNHTKTFHVNSTNEKKNPHATELVTYIAMHFTYADLWRLIKQNRKTKCNNAT